MKEEECLQVLLEVGYFFFFKFQCFLNQDFYKGQFKRGKYTGSGRLRFAQGVYQGCFINGFFEGYGKILIQRKFKKF